MSPKTNKTSKFAVNPSPVYISDNLTAKMEGIPAISTNCTCNKRCMERAKNPNSICSKCFATATVKRYNALAEHLTANTELLTSRILDDDELPRMGFNVGMLRFEAFGDLINIEQAINYLNIARINAHVHCAIWTKNPDILQKAVNAVGKPNNLVCVYSSPILNSPVKFETISRRYPCIDKVFTVYDKKTIAEKNLNVNCGGRSCKACGRCYFDLDTKEIIEQLK